MMTTTDDHCDSTTTEVHTTVPVIEEKVIVDSLKVVTGTVTVQKDTVTEQETLQLPVKHTEYREKRIPINREVSSVPSRREEGNTIVIPVVREEAVVVKRLILVEEIHLTKVECTEERTEVIDLQRDVVTVTRE